MMLLNFMLQIKNSQKLLPGENFCHFHPLLSLVKFLSYKILSDFNAFIEPMAIFTAWQKI